MSKGNASGVHDYIETCPEVDKGTAMRPHFMANITHVATERIRPYEVLLHQGSYEDPLSEPHTLVKRWERLSSGRGSGPIRWISRVAGHTSDIISAKAAEAVASLSRPWLIEAHFKEPHGPFHYPPRYEGLTGAPAYDSTRDVWTLRGFDVAEPPTLMQRPTRCRGIDVFANRSLANATRRRTYAQLVADYLETLKALDDGVGRVLRRVDDDNARARRHATFWASTAATTSG